MKKGKTRYRKRNEEEEDDSDEVYDEIDRFHMERNDLSDSEGTRPKKRIEEVLNVEGDISEDEEELVDDSPFDSDDSDDNGDAQMVLPSADKWGSKRSSYYSTSYVDGDWGGMNESDAEIAALEEEDATARQKKLDAALASVHYDLMDEEVQVAEVLEPAVDVERMDEQQKLNFFLSSNPEFEKMLAEYTEKRKVLLSLLMPLVKVARTVKGERKTVLEQQLSTAYCVFSSYLLNILFYFHLKSTSNLANSESKRYLDEHPVLDCIVSQKKKMLKVESFLEANAAALKAILDSADHRFAVENAFLRSGYADEVAKKKAQPVSSVLEATPESGDLGELHDGNEDDDSELKRSITLQMEKNRGLSTKRKKGTQHSRVKKRKQYEKALVKKRSQRPEVRREMAPYGGEKRGIRVSTVKSVKLKA